ncbi:hypothetical protein GCM10009799_46700 [Nocardiopsis rhodophaea]|uniref:Acyl carrier protein n=1 Tax=Nocardiopsis rhodophaea TaxID=280238 RepID=A0ABP5F0G3_9ACTN
MEELQKIFSRLFAERTGGETPDADTVVFGADSTYGLESMETLRFVSELLPTYGDKVYDLRVEEMTTLRSVHDQLKGA